MRNTLKFPKGTPSREALDAWLEELATADSKRQGAVVAVDPAQSWGPEAHADENDPVAGTKMVI